MKDGIILPTIKIIGNLANTGDLATYIFFDLSELSGLVLGMWSATAAANIFRPPNLSIGKPVEIRLVIVLYNVI